MAVPVLVISSSTGFGTLIQELLERNGRYRVFVASTLGEAERTTPSGAVSLCILDIGEMGAFRGELSRRARLLYPDARLIYTLPGEQLPALLPGESAPDGFLPRPFRLPDLIELLEDVLHRPTPSAWKASPLRLLKVKTEKSSKEKNEAGKEAPVQPAKPAPDPKGASDSELNWLRDVARAAQHLARLSMETAAQAALIVYQERLWAYAGELPREAAEELAGIIGRNWTGSDGGDMARFIHLDRLGSDFMLYATRLGEEMLLALVFDIEVPFGKIRSQASKLAHNLASMGMVDESPTEPKPEEPSEEKTQKIEVKKEPPLFEDVPLPTVPQPPPAEPAASKPEPPKAPEAPPPQPGKAQPGGQVQFEPVPLPQEAGSLAGGSARQELPLEGSLFPASPGYSDLTLACVLIPRFPSHRLSGDLSERLDEWLSRICLAYDWRLVDTVVQAGSLAWIVQISPTDSPHHMLRLVRKHTSEWIFADFPAFRRENPASDFWAPGYLVASSAQLPTAEVIQSFIQQTRQHQGVRQPVTGQN